MSLIPIATNSIAGRLIKLKKEPRMISSIRLMIAPSPSKGEVKILIVCKLPNMRSWEICEL